MKDVFDFSKVADIAALLVGATIVGIIFQSRNSVELAKVLGGTFVDSLRVARG